MKAEAKKIEIASQNLALLRSNQNWAAAQFNFLAFPSDKLFSNLFFKLSFG